MKSTYGHFGGVGKYRDTGSFEGSFKQVENETPQSILTSPISPAASQPGIKCFRSGVWSC
jgi:hypothetical protein